MIYLAMALMIVGAVLLIAEIFMPGFGICGVSGILLLITSCVMTILFHPLGVLIVGGEVLAVGAILYGAFKYIRKNQLYGKLILNETLNEDKKDIGGLDFFLGKEGTTKTSLRPYGMADFNGTSVEVYSDGAYVAEKKKIKVYEISGQRIFVKPVENSN